MFTLSMAERILRKLDFYHPLSLNGAVYLKSMSRDQGPYDLTNVSTVTSAAGPSNTLRHAASFAAASSQRLDASDADNLSIRGDTTIAGWMYLEDKPASQRAAVMKWTGTGNQREWTWGWYTNSDDRLRFSISTDGTAGALISAIANNFGSPPTQTWMFVVGQYRAATGKTYISVNAGAFDVASASGGVPFNGTGAYSYGANFVTGSYFNGRVVHIAKWSRLLSQTEIEWLYNNGHGRYLLPLV